MSCEHKNRRAVLGRLAGDGRMTYGPPPQSEDEPAWCKDCGALWCMVNFIGWGWLAPTSDRTAPTPTLLNMLADRDDKP